MAGQRQQSKRGGIAMTAVLLVLSGWLMPAAVAAPDRGTLCHEDRDATLAIRTESMSKGVDELREDHLLKPRVAEKARKVFTDSDSETDADETTESDVEDGEHDTSPGLRPVSDAEEIPVRRRMYRRDI